MRRGALAWVTRSLFFGLGVSMLACEGGPEEPPDSGVSPFYLSSLEHEKARLYNLVGRWYPEAEIDRLRDPTLTPEMWCAREPVRLFIHQDRVEVYCEKDAPKRASIARVKTSSKAGDLTLLLRASKESSLRELRFEISGASAVISGNPCFAGKPTMHRRFPEFEILTRQILAGRRCSQVIDGATGVTPLDESP